MAQPKRHPQFHPIDARRVNDSLANAAICLLGMVAMVLVGLCAGVAAALVGWVGGLF